MNKINKILILIIFLSLSSTNAQNLYFAEIVKLDNDTVKVQIKIPGPSWSVVQLRGVQTKIDAIENGILHEYFPTQIKSFRIKLDKRIVIFDSYRDQIFAERLYKNKVKLYKYLQTVSHNNVIRRYLIAKPDNINNYDVPAMGLSNLITRKSLLPAIEDCPLSYEKIKNEEIKIKDEEAFVEFIKDYEKNCF